METELSCPICFRNKARNYKPFKTKGGVKVHIKECHGKNALENLIQAKEVLE